jgi:hypothetical protein
MKSMDLVFIWPFPSQSKAKQQPKPKVSAVEFIKAREADHNGVYNGQFYETSIHSDHWALSKERSRVQSQLTHFVHRRSSFRYAVVGIYGRTDDDEPYYLVRRVFDDTDKRQGVSGNYFVRCSSVLSRHHNLSQLPQYAGITWEKSGIPETGKSRKRHSTSNTLARTMNPVGVERIVGAKRKGDDNLSGTQRSPKRTDGQSSVALTPSKALPSREASDPRPTIAAEGQDASISGDVCAGFISRSPRYNGPILTGNEAEYAKRNSHGFVDLMDLDVGIFLEKYAELVKRGDPKVWNVLRFGYDKFETQLGCKIEDHIIKIVGSPMIRICIAHRPAKPYQPFFPGREYFLKCRRLGGDREIVYIELAWLAARHNARWMEFSTHDGDVVDDAGGVTAMVMSDTLDVDGHSVVADSDDDRRRDNYQRGFIKEDDGHLELLGHKDSNRAENEWIRRADAARTTGKNVKSGLNYIYDKGKGFYYKVDDMCFVNDKDEKDVDEEESEDDDDEFQVSKEKAVHIVLYYKFACLQRDKSGTWVQHGEPQYIQAAKALPHLEKQKQKKSVSAEKFNEGVKGYKWLSQSELNKCK